MPKSSAAPAPKSSPSCSASPRALRPRRPATGADCILKSMPTPVSRRRFLEFTAAGLSFEAMPGLARAQLATQPPAKPVPIEVNARPIASFDTRDHSRVRFKKLEYRSGLVLTSAFPGFGGLSGWRLDAKGERFISFSDKGTWFTGRILYRGP